MMVHTMTLRRLMTFATLLAALALAPLPGAAQGAPPVPSHEAHAYSAEEARLRETVSQFHKNFNERSFDKNGALVADGLHVNSNGVESTGRDTFVKQIARFVVPFPDVRITDLVTTVDGNVATIRFLITGTHQGDLETPEGVVHATGKPIMVEGIEFFTFARDGKLIDLLTVENLGKLMKQIKNAD